MGKSEGDEKILSYNDVVLRKSDLEILSGPYYLNDRIIEFYFSYLSTTHPSNDILLSPPSIAFWIMNCPDAESLSGFLEPLNLHDKKLVIFPVNDNNDVSKPEGGNHWSLLAFYKEENIFVHHDSNKGMNKYDAKRLYKAVAGFMNGDLNSTSTSNPSYVECIESPQQVNGYDCGVYVTAIARSICKWYEERREVEKDGLWFSAVVEEISPLVVANMRREILGLIRNLMALKEYQPATK